jgi:hypothetical protein
VNPARSLGPTIVGVAYNPEALKQIWLYVLAPLLGAGAAGYLFRSGVLAAETVIPPAARAERMYPRPHQHLAKRSGDKLSRDVRRGSEAEIIAARKSVWLVGERT